MTAWRCLIVDDEPGVLHALQRLLVLWGHETCTASSGEEALALLERESFDLIMLDQRMPGLSGIETWQRIRGRGGVVPPAVLVTAALEGEGLARSHGMWFLAKPFDVESLEAMLERVLRAG
jgi:DNA-binding response OmpR family regulator